MSLGAADTSVRATKNERHWVWLPAFDTPAGRPTQIPLVPVGLFVQFEVQGDGIDAGFAEEAEFAALGDAGDELFHLGGRDAAGFGYAGDLGFGVGDGDFRVEAAAGGGEGVGGMAPV
jgi:hypothetical protein